MHALIKQGAGKYYLSPIFGYYKDVKSEDDYQRYLENIHSAYYVVLDPEKTHLIKCFEMQPGTKYLILQLLIVDCDRHDWVMAEDGTGGVDFLSREEADRMIAAGNVPKDIMKKCLEADRSYEYKEYPEIYTEKDIQNLDWVSGNFHDGYIAESKLLEDGMLYVKFDDIWGCSIEIWFWGDLEYNLGSRGPESYYSRCIDDTPCRN